MAYFYFDFKNTAKQDARAALSSILVQLCYQSDSFSDILSQLLSDHRSGTIQPSDDTLVTLSPSVCLTEAKYVVGSIRDLTISTELSLDSTWAG